MACVPANHVVGVCLHSMRRETRLRTVQVAYSSIMGVVFFNEHLTLSGVAGAALILAGVLLVTLRAAPRGMQVAAPVPHECAAAGETTGAAAANDEARPADRNVQLAKYTGATAAAGAAAEINAGEQGGLETGAECRLLRVGPSGSFKQALEVGAGCMEDGGEAAAAAASVAEAAEAASRMGLFAASAAAALGGELCPASSTALGLSPQLSLGVQLAAAGGMSQLSRQPSWLASTPTRFMNTTVLGLDDLSGLASPAAADADALEAEEQQQQLSGARSLLQQALLAAARGSFRRRSSNSDRRARQDEQQQQQHQQQQGGEPDSSAAGFNAATVVVRSSSRLSSTE